MRLVVEIGDPRPEYTGGPQGAETHLPEGSREFRIEQEALIGRGPDCDVVLAQHGVSRQHARLYLDSPGAAGTYTPGSDARLASSSSWYLIDLGTTNGTFVNGRRLEAHRPERLATGDRIAIGSSMLVVHDLERPERPGRDAQPLMGLHPIVRGVAALLFVAALVAIVALLVLALQPDPQAQQTVVPTAGNPLDVIATVLPTGVPQDLLEPLDQILTSQPGIPFLGTPGP